MSQDIKNDLKKLLNGRVINMGVLGSCVSRMVFASAINKTYKNFFKLEIDRQRSLFPSLIQNPVKFTEKDITILPENKDNSVKRFFVRNDLNKSFFEELKNKNIEYLIMDFEFEAQYGILFGTTQYNENVTITDNYNDLYETSFYKNMKNKRSINLTDNTEEYVNLWKDACDIVFKKIKKINPNVKIILHPIRQTWEVKDDDGSVYLKNDWEEICTAQNKGLKILEDYVCDNFKVIKLKQPEVYLNKNHMWGLCRVHYTDDYYNSIFDQLIEIAYNDIKKNNKITNENEMIKKDSDNIKLSNTMYKLKETSDMPTLDDHYFVLDSENLDLNSKLYGFAIIDGKIITNDNLNVRENEPTEGCFVLLNRKNEYELRISQDYIGSYGLYLYQNENYFAISNSFLKLVEHVKDKYPLSLNDDYVKSFTATDLLSLAYKETMVNEIKEIPRNANININIKNKTFEINKIDYKESSILISSREGIKELDKWFFKYIKLIRNLKKDNYTIKCDLSGGFDTRLTFLLLLCSDIPLDNIRIHSRNNTSTQSEDFEIATQISKKFNFKLNEPLQITKSEINNELIIYNSFYAKMGFHKEMYFQHFRYDEPVITLSGNGGDNIRYFGLTDEDYIKRYEATAKNKWSDEFIEPTVNILVRTFTELEKNYPNDIKHSRDFSRLVFREIRTRSHYGKQNAERFFANDLHVNPLIDSNLYKLTFNDDKCDDHMLLIALIFVRYCPELLEFKFEGNREIKPSTIEYAKEINKKYPLEKIPSNILPNTYLLSIFKSEEFKNKYSEYYEPEIYNKIINDVEVRKHFPLTNVYPAIGIMKIRDWCKDSEDTTNN